MVTGDASPHAVDEGTTPVTHHAIGRRWLSRLTTGTTTAGLILLAAPAVLDGSTAAEQPAGSPATTTASVQLVGHHKPHPHRKIKKYRVRPGDTPSSLAVRYHAWTAQLIRMNHTSVLYVGQVIRIPVVVRAARACTRHKDHFTGFYGNKHRHHHDRTHAKPSKHRPAPHNGKGHDKGQGKGHGDRDHAQPSKAHHGSHRHHRGWTHAHASKAEVRRVIIRKADRLGVNPDLALAISWQEAGWQQKRLSPAGAIGAMQVMPSTGRWMSMLAGRRLHLRDLHDNVTAGVLLIRTLRGQAGLKRAVAGYYQGLAGVERYGMYPSTKRYVANVLHLKKRIARGWNPA